MNLSKFKSFFKAGKFSPTKMTARQRIKIEIIIGALLIAIAALIIWRVNVSADTIGITNQAAVKYCAEGEAADKCDPATGLYSYNAASNILTVTKNIPTQILTFTSNPTVTGKTTTTVTISWATSVPTTGIVNYSTSKTNLNLSSPDTNSTTTHKITISGLNKNTAYYFKVTATDGNGSKITSTLTNFRTKNK